MRVDWRAWADRLRHGDPTDARAHIRRLIRDDQPVPREDLAIAEQIVRSATWNKLLVPMTVLVGVAFLVSVGLIFDGGGPVWWTAFGLGSSLLLAISDIRWRRQAMRWAAHYLSTN